jgi:hypothetical protein
MLRSCHLKGDVRIVRLGSGPGSCDHVSRHIDPHYLGAALAELDGELPVATADVENLAARDVACEFEDEPAFEPLGDGAKLGGAPLGIRLGPEIGDGTR